jgi:exopolysaccharide biosynthesis protein
VCAGTLAGFFSISPPGCLGNIVVNGTVASWGNYSAFVNVGFTAAGATLIGFLPGNASAVERYGITSLVQGFNWLVRNGTKYQTDTGERAPRTGVGVRSDGTVLLVVVDGVETLGIGPTTADFAEVFLNPAIGAVHAVNLDGGGSTDAVLEGRVWDFPTCLDVPWVKCERPVPTLSCVRY